MDMDKPQPQPKAEPTKRGVIPRWVMLKSLDVECDYKRWLRAMFDTTTAERIIREYYIGGSSDIDAAIFWQIDHCNRVRTGKIMNYDPTTGKRRKGEEAYLNWVHSLLRNDGALPEGWELEQCLYGEHLLNLRPTAIVALAEGAKTAHIGSALMPDMVWVAVDAMLSLSEERLAPLKGRSVILFPDEGRGFKEWSERIAPIAKSIGFRYSISDFMQRNPLCSGGDIADLMAEKKTQRAVPPAPLPKPPPSPPPLSPPSPPPLSPPSPPPKVEVWLNPDDDVVRLSGDHAMCPLADMANIPF